MSISSVDTDTLERLRKAHLARDHFVAVLGWMKNEAVSAGSEHFRRETRTRMMEVGTLAKDFNDEVTMHFIMGGRRTLAR